MNDQAPAGHTDEASATDPRVAEILDIFAKETRIERSQLRLDARPDELGVASLDLTLAVFEIESRFGIDIPSIAIDPTAPGFSVGSLVDAVIEILDRKATASGEKPHDVASPPAAVS